MNYALWNLPTEVIHPETKHIVGRVYRDDLFIAFERAGQPYYDLNATGTVLQTQDRLFLRLTSDTPSQGMKTWGGLLNKAIFDECLCGDTKWTEEEPCFTRMRLPCDNIMEYMSVCPIEEDHADDGSMTAKALSFDRFPFSLPGLNAKGCVKFTYDWSRSTFVEQHFTARAELVLQYEAPTPLSTIKAHEERLRSFFDYIWFRGHKNGMLYLHANDRMAMLHRRESISPEVNTAHCLDLRGILTQENLALWIERWFALPIPVRIALEPVVSVARNPGIITDIKMIMTVHALDAILKAIRRPTGNATEVRFLQGMRNWWYKKRDLGDEPLLEYLKRIIATRNLVLKASQHENQSNKPLLEPSDRAKAYYEMLVLHRALFLEVMGVEHDRIDTFVETGFGKLNAREFRYFHD